MTTQEIKQAIKNDLKNNNYKLSDFSIKTKSSFADTTILINIKNISINITNINKLLNKYEKYDMCERSYEILSGGNVFLFISYDYDMLLNASKEFDQLATEIYNNNINLKNTNYVKRLLDSDNTDQNYNISYYYYKHLITIKLSIKNETVDNMKNQNASIQDISIFLAQCKYIYNIDLSLIDTTPLNL